jgi:hypothetical protein
MTVEQVVRALARRWYIVAVGLACIAMMMVGAMGRAGVYTTQVDVVFLAPANPVGANILESSQDSLIYFAAIVATEVNEGKRAPRLSSATATLFGTGVRDGYSVALPNTGGQWANNFSRPVLDVQVVGPSAEKVRDVLAAVLGKIDTVAADHERAAGAPPATWITTELAPATPAVSYVSGQPRRGAMAIGMLGFAATALAAVRLDRWRARRPGAAVVARELAGARFVRTF